MDKEKYKKYKKQTNDDLKEQLKNKILRLKKQGKLLLVKLDSHPCAGKTHFIKKHNGVYRDLKLYDFDHFKEKDRTSKLLLKQTQNSVLLGT
jgi:formamidopyrimidine-DNA glycosylase